MPLLALIAIIWVGVSYGNYVSSLGEASSAPQQATAAAMGIISMFLPYAIIRILQANAMVEKQDEIIQLLRLGLPEDKKEKKITWLNFWKKAA